MTKLNSLAVAVKKAVVAMQKPVTAVAYKVTEQDIIELWEERAAIREFDGNMRRDLAERAAYFDLRKMLGQFVVPDAIREKVRLSVKESK